MRFEDDLDLSDEVPLLNMSRPNDDPFYTIRDEVKVQADQIKVRHEKFHDMVKNVDTSTNPEFIELRKSLVKDVRTVDRKLKGLKEAVEVVEKNRSKFPLIKDSELQSRRQFVESVQTIVNDVKAGLEAPNVRRKMESDTMNSQRKTYELSSSSNPLQQQGSNSSNIGPDPTTMNMRIALENENNRFVNDQKQQQKMMIRQQDQNLSALEKGVDSLGIMAKDIHQELKEQDKLLDALEKDIDDSSTRLETVMQSLNKLMKSKDGCQIWTIVILTIILIIMIALIIWT